MRCCHLLLLPTIKWVCDPGPPKQTKHRLWVSELLDWPVVSSSFEQLRSWCCWEDSPQRTWWKPKGRLQRAVLFCGLFGFWGLGKISSHAHQIIHRTVESLRLEKTLKSRNPTVSPAPPPCSPPTHVLKCHIHVLPILPGIVNLPLQWALYSTALQTLPGKKIS